MLIQSKFLQFSVPARHHRGALTGGALTGRTLTGGTLTGGTLKHLQTQIRA